MSDTVIMKSIITMLSKLSKKSGILNLHYLYPLTYTHKSFVSTISLNEQVDHYTQLHWGVLSPTLKGIQDLHYTSLTHLEALLVFHQLSDNICCTWNKEEPHL